MPSVDRRDGAEHLQIWEVTDLTWGTLTDLRVIYWVRDVTITSRVKVHGQRQTVTQSFAGWALTTVGPAVTALVVYPILHHRWDLENCRFRRTKPKWDFDHGFGHELGRITAVVGRQLLAVSVWKWWTSQPKRSARAHALP